ncbi:hypothetical protein SEET0012_10047, partial [Salmonella enterica subsp. enterica serovar Tallahassee str. 0012]
WYDYLLLLYAGVRTGQRPYYRLFLPSGRKHDSQSQSEDMASILALWMKVPFMPIPLSKNVTGTRAKQLYATS